MKATAFLWTIIFSMIFISCSGGDDENAFTISFQLDEYDATFYTPGQTEQLKISLDIGEGGDMDINVSADTDPSIFYNGATGAVEWTRELPLGINPVTVIALVEDKEASTQIMINNVFQGNFEGGYNFNPNSQILTSVNFSVQFNSDGTLVLDDDGYSATGTWTRSEDNIIQLTYNYDDYPTLFYTWRGPLVYNNSEAYISGLFYRGSTVVPGDERGYFRINFH